MNGPGLAYEYRQRIIDRVTDELVQQEVTEHQALSLFIWKLMAVEPPVSCEEQLQFCANFRLTKGFCQTVVDSKEKAMEILEMLPNKQGLPVRKLCKEARVLYWRQYNSLAKNLRLFQANAAVIGAKKKALDFLCNELP